MKTTQLLWTLAVAAVVIGGGVWAMRLYKLNNPSAQANTVPVILQISSRHEILPGPQDKLQALQARLADLNRRAEKATDHASRQALIQEADRVKADIKLAEAEVKADKLLAEDLIRVLKERVDPHGGGIEWRPVGGERFEVRRPPRTQPSSQPK